MKPENKIDPMGENFRYESNEVYSRVRCLPVDSRRSEHAQYGLHQINRKIYEEEAYLGKENGQ